MSETIDYSTPPPAVAEPVFVMPDGHPSHGTPEADQRNEQITEQIQRSKETTGWGDAAPPMSRYMSRVVLDEISNYPDTEPFTGPEDFEVNYAHGHSSWDKPRSAEPLPHPADIESARGAVLVGMDDAKSIIATPGEEKRIMTWGLAGCTAVAVAYKFADGSSKAHLQHFSDSHEDESVAALAMAVKELSPGAISGQAVMAGPTRESRLSPDGSKYVETDSIDTAVAAGLSDALVANSAIAVPFQFMPSQHMGSYGSAETYGDGTVIVKLAEDGRTTIFVNAAPILPPIDVAS